MSSLNTTPLNPKFAAQDVLNPDARITGRKRIHGWIRHVSHHHGLRARRDGVGEGQHVVAADFVECAPVDGWFQVGVLAYRTVAREVLDRGRHAGQAHVAHVFHAEPRDDSWICVEGTLTDNDIANGEVEHWREAQVDVDCAHLAHHQPGVLASQFQRPLRIARVNLADPRQCGQAREFAMESLHGPAFLVHADQQRFCAQRTDFRDQFAHLLARIEIALEQDHAADLRRTDPVALDGRKPLVLDSDDQHENSYSLSNTAIDSTCAVCGNMSMAPALIRVNPWRFTSVPASRASEPG